MNAGTAAPQVDIRRRGMRRVRVGSIATTPARLRLASVLLVAGVVALWAASALALEARHDAATSIESESAPLLIHAEELYVDLADADALASRAFLEGDLEPDVRIRYEENLSAAANQLGVIGDEVGADSGTQQAVAVVSGGLPEYASSVATARVNNRLGNPVGAAYLRQASDQMRNGILPEATTIFRDASRHMASDYRSGTSSPQVIVMAVVAGFVLIGLVTTQIYLFLRTQRILNVGLVVATALVIAAVAVSLVRFDNAQDDLVRAQREGSDHVHVLATARILALRAAERLDACGHRPSIHRRTAGPGRRARRRLRPRWIVVRGSGTARTDRFRSDHARHPRLVRSVPRRAHGRAGSARGTRVPKRRASCPRRAVRCARINWTNSSATRSQRPRSA